MGQARLHAQWATKPRHGLSLNTRIGLSVKNPTYFSHWTSYTWMSDLNQLTQHLKSTIKDRDDIIGHQSHNLYKPHVGYNLQGVSPTYHQPNGSQLTPESLRHHPSCLSAEYSVWYSDSSSQHYFGTCGEKLQITILFLFINGWEYTLPEFILSA